MRQNSYDVPAYKFGIFKLKNQDQNRKLTPEIFDNSLKNPWQNLILIPFENVDGLTAKEVKECLQTKDVVFVMYTQYNYETPQGKADVIKLYFQVFMDLDKEEGVIEEAIEKHLTGSYCMNIFEPENLRGVNCFFERYLDYSPKKTKKRIKKLEKAKKSIKQTKESSDNYG